MARIRTIKPDFFTSEDIMSLSPLARLLYIGTWLEADREGRLTWRLGTLKARYLPSDQCDVGALSQELIERGLIVLYGDGFAFIPSFKLHQFVNPREAKSKLPEPVEGEILRVTDASLRVSDAPSLPSYIPSLPSVPERSKIQGSGAFEPGSLPRDHMHHALCGPSMKICLKTWEYNTLAKAYNQLDNPHGTRALIAQFIEVLEKGVTPNESIGPFSWVEKQFHAYLKSIGRSAPSIQPKHRGVAEIVAEREAQKRTERVS